MLVATPRSVWTRAQLSTSRAAWGLEQDLNAATRFGERRRDFSDIDSGTGRMFEESELVRSVFIWESERIRRVGEAAR